MDKLKPCPFCGGVAELYDEDGEELYFVGKCTQCEAQTIGSEDKKEAINQWNGRA